jgi:GR25 family glycosyltransferase involved in LPS biosynthesis
MDVSSVFGEETDRGRNRGTSRGRPSHHQSLAKTTRIQKVKYNIISINDERESYKENIRRRVKLDEVFIPTINAYEVDVYEELEKRGLSIKHTGMFSAGEIGIWLSTFDCWQWAVDNDEELITFEDDAIPTKEFNTWLWDMRDELPDGWDFFCLWVPENQLIDYLYDADFDHNGQMVGQRPNKNVVTSVYNFGAIRIARVYNGYGNVAQLYSPKGAKFFIDRARSDGIATPVDCFLYQEAHAGRCQGFAPKPNRAKLVTYDWAAETTVHKEDRV